jgi:hypothetical protein
MNRHRHSRCRYKRNSDSTPAGTNNLHIGEPAGRQTPSGSPPTTAAATTTSAPGGQTAAVMTLGQMLLRQGPRPRPHSRGEDKQSKPKSQRPGAQLVPTISSAEKPSPVATTSALTAACNCTTRMHPFDFDAPSMKAQAHTSCNWRVGYCVQKTAPPLTPMSRLLDCGTGAMARGNPAQGPAVPTKRIGHRLTSPPGAAGKPSPTA